MKTNTKVILMVAAFILILLIHGAYNIFNPDTYCSASGLSMIKAESYVYVFDFILAGIIICLLISMKDYKKNEQKRKK